MFAGETVCDRKRVTRIPRGGSRLGLAESGAAIADSRNVYRAGGNRIIADADL